MRWLRFAGWLCLAITGGQCQQLTPAWVEVGEGGATFARVIVASSAACPSISLDGVEQAMAPRLPVPQGFLPACEAAIPAAAASAQVNGQKLVVPKPDPSRIVVFGDTGCRIKGAQIQDCNNPDTWPFPSVAAQAAAASPDLMIHVGDYLYREDMCPASKRDFCGGTPSGDNWETWNADFFTPAAKLLAAVT